MKTFVCAAVLGVMFASASSADVIIKMKETRDLGSKSPKVGTGAMIIGSDRLTMRWDRSKDEKSGGVIFRGDKDLMWVVDDQKKVYHQIDKAFADQMSAQIAAAHAEMQARIDKMPPEERAKAEAMMKQYGGAMKDAGSESKMDYRKTAATRMINGHLCTKYDAYSGKDLVGYDWVAPYSALNLNEGDGEVFQKMGEFVAKLSGPWANVQKDYIPMHELRGVPLLAQTVEGGKVVAENTVESVTRGGAPSGSYEVPAGYQLKPMEGMGRKK